MLSQDGLGTNIHFRVGLYTFVLVAMAAQCRSFFDDVKKELECCVCQEQFEENNEPKILKCLHTFCKSCLERWLRQQGGRQLSCPTKSAVKSPNVPTTTLTAFHQIYFTSKWWELLRLTAERDEKTRHNAETAINEGH